MEFRQLRYFIAVAEELHFGRASKRLRMTGPPLSQQIQALERELGVELFVRGRHIELTAAGRAFLEQARCATEAVNHAAQVAREVGGETTRLRLGYPAAVASRCASMAVRMYRERFPETVLETVVGHTGTHLTALSARQLDVAFVLSGIRWERAGRFRPLHPERFLVAMPKEHPLARLRAVRVEHLAREPVVLFPRALDPAVHDHLVVDVCGRAGVSLSVMLEATTLESSLGAVADGLGIAFTAESVVDLITVPGITFRPLVATVPALQVGVAWRREATSKAVQQFLVIVDELARGPRLPNRDGRADRHNGHRQGAARVTNGESRPSATSGRAWVVARCLRTCRISCSVSEFVADGLLARAESYRYPLRDQPAIHGLGRAQTHGRARGNEATATRIEQVPAWPPIAACVQ